MCGFAPPTVTKTILVALLPEVITHSHKDPSHTSGISLGQDVCRSEMKVETVQQERVQSHRKEKKESKEVTHAHTPGDEYKEKHVREKHADEREKDTT